MSGYSDEHAQWYKKTASSIVIKAFVDPQSKLYRPDLAKILQADDDEAQPSGVKEEDTGRGSGGGSSRGRGRGRGRRGRPGGKSKAKAKNKIQKLNGDQEDDEEEESVASGEMSEEANSE